MASKHPQFEGEPTTLSNVNIFSELPIEQFEEGFDPLAVNLPLRKGRYDGVITFQDRDADPAEQWGQMNGGPPTHYWTNLRFTVAEGQEGEGKAAFAFIGTKPFALDKKAAKPVLTSQAAEILRKLNEKDRAKEAESPVALAQAVTHVLGGGKPATVDVDWETGSCRACGQRGVKWTTLTPTGVRGEDNFPRDEDGNPIPLVPCPTCGEELKARAAFSARNVVSALPI